MSPEIGHPGVSLSWVVEETRPIHYRRLETLRQTEEFTTYHEFGLFCFEIY